MAASDALKTKLYRLLEQACYKPEATDWGAIARTVVEIRGAGTPCQRLVVKQRPEHPLGVRLAAEHAKALVGNPDIPPLEWMGRKNPDVPSRQISARWNGDVPWWDAADAAEIAAD